MHLVEDALDSGPIVAQSTVEVTDADTLATLEARVHAAEHALFPAAVQRYLTERWRLDGRRVRFGEGPGLELPETEAAHG